MVSTQRKEKFIFPSFYRPIYSIEDKELRNRIIIYYRITAKYQTRGHIDTKIKRIELPFIDYNEKEEKQETIDIKNTT